MSGGRAANVRNHGVLAGRLEELPGGGFRFAYVSGYDGHAVSLTLPVRAEPYTASTLFSFFYGLLAEGATRQLQHRLLRVDEDDPFGLLLATGGDTVGSVSVEPAEAP